MGYLTDALWDLIDGSVQPHFLQKSRKYQYSIFTNFTEILIRTQFFYQENAFENVVYTMAAILFRPLFGICVVYLMYPDSTLAIDTL